ncbi:hypothetical protein ACV07N_01945 [Roseivirga echinicomitans]
MKAQIEKWILLVLIVVISVCLLLQHVVGVENFSDPVMTKYWIELVLYPSCLAVLILIWRLTLDKKIDGKQQREEKQNDLHRED